jgi:hypothetical protein
MPRKAHRGCWVLLASVPCVASWTDAPQFYYSMGALPPEAPPCAGLPQTQTLQKRLFDSVASGMRAFSCCEAFCRFALSAVERTWQRPCTAWHPSSPVCPHDCHGSPSLNPWHPGRLGPMARKKTKGFAHHDYYPGQVRSGQVRYSAEG